MAAFAAAIVSCARDSAVPDLIEGLEVSGKVYDAASREGVPDMMVVLTAYGDAAMEHAVDRDTAYSDSGGFFSIRTISRRNGWKFTLSVKDTDETRPGGPYHQYSEFDPVLHADFGGHSFDSATGVYRFEVPVPVARNE